MDRVLFLLFGAVILASSTIAQAGKDVSLQDYMKMDRDAQHELILDTTDAVLDKFIAERDLDRAKCVAGLFPVNEKGNQDWANTKGLLKAAAEDGFTWTARQVTAHTIMNIFCPATDKPMVTN